MSGFDDRDWYETNTIEKVIGRLRWLRDTVSDRVWTVLFGVVDVLVDGSKEATNVAFVENCPDDAVAHHGRASLMEQTPWESTAAYRLRIKDRWSFWSNVGPKAVTVDGVAYGLRAAIRTYTNLSTLEVYDVANDAWFDGAIAGEDDNADNWSRVAIVLPEPHPYEVPIAGPLGPIAGPELLCGTTMTQTELSRIRRAFRLHRPAHIIGIDIYILYDATSAAAVLADHGASSDFIRLPLGPYRLAGYPHHCAYAGHIVCGAEVV